MLGVMLLGRVLELPHVGVEVQVDGVVSGGEASVVQSGGL